MMAGMPRKQTLTPVPVNRALRRIGEYLITWRKLHRLTRAQIADRAGVSVGTVAQLEHGKGGTLENTLRVARAVGMLEPLAAALDPYTTDVGRLRSEEELPQRVRRPGRSHPQPTSAQEQQAP